MGLDSVELLLKFENYFKISVPDTLAEKVETIQDMADLAVRLKGIRPQASQLQARIHNRVVAVLQEMRLTSEDMPHTAPVFLHLLPSDTETWAQFCERLQLTVPKPEAPPKSGIRQWLRTNIWHVTYDRDAITLGRFITVICAANYATLIDPNTLQDPFEAYCAVVALTADQIGVDLYEIEPWKSLSNDLGMD
jgi:hypothetical protein